MKALLFCILWMLTGCSTWKKFSTESETNPKDWTGDVRMAEAPLSSPLDTRIQGQVNFEQMPNSVIVTFHLEGLNPKSNYKLFLYPNQSCDKVKTPSTQLMTPLRTGDAGIAENTFKIQDLKVTSLAGDTVALWSAATPPNKKHIASKVACGVLRPQARTAPQTPIEPTE